MLEAEELCQAISFASVLQEGLTYEIPAKLSAQRILSVTSYLSPILYIPPLPTKVREAISERKTLNRFSTTQHTHLLERELLILSKKSL